MIFYDDINYYGAKSTDGVGAGLSLTSLPKNTGASARSEIKVIRPSSMPRGFSPPRQ
jgi:hypothetical protein